MQTSVAFTLAAGLSICGVGVAAADSDVSVWRWHVSNALRAQQNESALPRLREARASAFDPGFFRQRYERFFADGSREPPAEPAAR